MRSLSGASPPFSGETLVHVFSMLHSLDIGILWGGQLQGGVRLGGKKSKVPFPWINLAWPVINGNPNSVACKKINSRESALWYSPVFKQIRVWCSLLLPLQPDYGCCCLLGNVNSYRSTGCLPTILPGVRSWRQSIRENPEGKEGGKGGRIVKSKPLVIFHSCFLLVASRLDPKAVGAHLLSHSACKSHSLLCFLTGSYSSVVFFCFCLGLPSFP